MSAAEGEAEGGWKDAEIAPDITKPDPSSPDENLGLWLCFCRCPAYFSLSTTGFLIFLGLVLFFTGFAIYELVV